MVANSLFITGTTETTRTWIKETGGSKKEQGIKGSRVKATRKQSTSIDAKEGLKVVLRQHANCRLCIDAKEGLKVMLRQHANCRLCIDAKEGLKSRV